MEAIKEINQLLNISKSITDSVDKYHNVYLKDEKHYDKLGFGFNIDSRFAACQGLNLYVSSWKGTYGNSGSSTILDVNKDVFNNHLLKVLSADFWNIMQKVSDSILKEAATLKERAQIELKNELDKINSL